MLYHQTAIKDVRGVIFYVFGNQSFKNFVYAIPYYFPVKYYNLSLTPKNAFYKKIEEDRVSKMGYFRVHDLSKSLFLAKKLEYKVEDDSRFGIPIVKLEKNKIKKYFLKKRRGIIISRIIKYFDISKNEISIVRSVLTGLNTPESNIDIAIFGRKNFKKIFKDFDKFILKNDYKPYIQKRKKRHLSLIPKKYKKIKKFFLKKKVFSFNDKKRNYDFHFINLEGETQNFSFIKSLGIVKIKARIISSSESYFFPYMYQIKVLDSNIKKFKTYLITYNQHFSGLFSKGDIINIKAKKNLISINGKKIISFFLLETI